MKKVILIAIIFLSASLAHSQTVEVSIEDLKKFREAVISAESYKKQVELLQTQSDGWQKSSENWQKLYLSEKSRADNIQGNLIKECDASKADLGKANFELKEQSRADKQKIGELEFSLRKLKSERKWFFAAGFGTGAFVGYKSAKRFNF